MFNEGPQIIFPTGNWIVDYITLGLGESYITKAFIIVGWIGLLALMIYTGDAHIGMWLGLFIFPPLASITWWIAMILWVIFF